MREFGTDREYAKTVSADNIKIDSSLLLGPSSLCIVQLIHLRNALPKHALGLPPDSEQ